MGANSAFQLLNLILLAAERGIPLVERLAEVKIKVDLMESEDRDPTPAEWNEITELLGGDAEDDIERAARRARQNRDGGA